MEIEITNVTDNTIIDCSSFTFIPYGTLLPGWFESPNPGSETPVWCKDWSRVSVNLSGLAGKTIRLFFKTADCTFRRHFGYAYIDINSECGSEILGAAYCPDDSLVNVVAPYGYQSYTWFNESFSQHLGSEQILTLIPPPASGTTYAVEVVPYSGFGCLDTLYARLFDTLTITPDAGDDAIYCNDHPVQLGSNSKPGWVYSWSPVTGLNLPNIANPVASPLATTTYVLETRHDGGGCRSKDSVLVTSSAVDNSIELIGKPMYCADYGDSALLKVQPTDNIQWYKNDQLIPGATQATYRVTGTGTYYAVLSNNKGCSASTSKQEILVETEKDGIRYPVQYAVINIPLELEARPFGISALWSPPTYLDNASGYSPIFKSLADQQYTIEIKTITGCLTVDTQLVKTITHVDIFVPGAFTPNSDGLNDLLFPTLLGIKELRFFRVFNRWGQLLFETRTQRAGWDGNQKGVQQGSQAVVWMAEGLGVDGKIYLRKGTSILIR